MTTAVPVQTDSEDSKLSGHFGSAPFIAVFDDELDTLNFVDRSKKAGGSCAPVEELAALGVQRVISLGMGKGAMSRLASAGITCSFVVKSPGTLDRFRAALAEGKVLLSDDAGVCAGHDHGHCNH